MKRHFTEFYTKEEIALYLEFCKRTAKKIYSDKIRKRTLAVIQVGNDPRSDVYVRNKLKVAEEYGIKTKLVKLSKDTDVSTLVTAINNEAYSSIHTAVLVQLPLPANVRSEYILNKSQLYRRDVDCITEKSYGKFMNNSLKSTAPCTAKAIVDHMTYVQTNSDKKWDGQLAVIYGRSKLVGEPIAKLLRDKFNMTTVLVNSHSKVDHVAEITKKADLVILATPEVQSFHTVLDRDTVVYDVTIGVENDKVVGAVDKTIANMITCTPVPNGVGLMTVHQLMWNVLEMEMD